MVIGMNERLTGKLSRIRSGAYEPADFIIADAKDAEMGGGIGGLGSVTDRDGTRQPATALDYRQAMTDMMSSGLVDIMLTSLSSAESLHEADAFRRLGRDPGHPAERRYGHLGLQRRLVPHACGAALSNGQAGTCAAACGPWSIRCDILQ